MKADTYVEFRHIENELAGIRKELGQLATLVAALVDEGSDRTAAKALAAEVLERTKALKDAIPKL